ncbi:MAG TPA: hypothetical protein VLL48_14105 [Longimicrobiales bacterium]|nr:hypothetical protein [Longimicrobiales bacterium]
MTYWTWSAVIFAVAAAGGAAMLILEMREREVPIGLALGHGLLAAVALGLLVLSVFGGGASTLVISALVLFLVAALGGFVLFASHLRTGTFPLLLAWVHGGAAAVALALLIAGLYG